MATSTLLPPVAQEFRDFMRHWPTGVAIVTTAGPDGPVGCTVNALMSLSVESDGNEPIGVRACTPAGIQILLESG